MNPGLETLLTEMRRGAGASCALLHGDDFQVREGVRAILDLVAPAAERSFSLERFDGRAASWEQIEASLMTPPLFTSRKTLWIENAPYFLSREHKADLREQALDLWRQGKPEEGARHFFDLLLSSGWTQERWESAGARWSSDDLRDLFGEDSEEVRAAAEGLADFCRSRAWTLARQGGGEAERLMTLLEQDLPDWSFLLMTAAHVDRRNRLYRRFADRGAVIDLSLTRDRTGRINKDSVRDFLRRRLKEAGKKIDSQAQELIVNRAGEELWAVHHELEKLLLYVGDRPSVGVEDAAEVVLDLSEGWIFDLTRAIGERDPLAALGHLERLLSQGDHPLRLLAVIASEARRLLAARQLIESDLRGSWRAEMSFEEFHRAALTRGAAPSGRNPYAEYMALKRAATFTAAELIAALRSIYDADVRLKSSSHPPRLVLERLVLGMCRGRA